jgi:hypothetical protein
MPLPEALSARDVALQTLPGVARASIEHGFEVGAPLDVDPERFHPLLRGLGASFVTLRVCGELRGCTGSLEASRPLVADVARHGFCAAFRDSRFAALGIDELAKVRIHVSVLGPREPLRAASEAQLLSQLRPGIDGLVLEDGPRLATFLPAVWEQLSEPREFLVHLKRKAGLPADHWSATLGFSRYTVREVEE